MTEPEKCDPVVDTENKTSEAVGSDSESVQGEKALHSAEVMKPITLEELQAFKAKQERAGIIYISRIPPAMRPSKVRHLMSQYGAIGRIYLQQEGICTSADP
jgi:ESF2/ABP1 family protein